MAKPKPRDPRPSKPITPPSGHDELEVMLPNSHYVFEGTVSLRWKTPPDNAIREALGEKIAQAVQKIIRGKIRGPAAATRPVVSLHGWLQVIP